MAREKSKNLLGISGRQRSQMVLTVMTCPSDSCMSLIGMPMPLAEVMLTILCFQNLV